MATNLCNKIIGNRQKLLRLFLCTYLAVIFESIQESAFLSNWQCGTLQSHSDHSLSYLQSIRHKGILIPVIPSVFALETQNFNVVSVLNDIVQDSIILNSANNILNITKNVKDNIMSDIDVKEFLSKTKLTDALDNLKFNISSQAPNGILNFQDFFKVDSSQINSPLNLNLNALPIVNTSLSSNIQNLEDRFYKHRNEVMNGQAYSLNDYSAGTSNIVANSVSQSAEELHLFDFWDKQIESKVGKTGSIHRSTNNGPFREFSTSTQITAIDKELAKYGYPPVSPYCMLEFNTTFYCAGISDANNDLSQAAAQELKLSSSNAIPNSVLKLLQSHVPEKVMISYMLPKVNPSPKNKYLANSAWPAPHGGSYAQASTGASGVTADLPIRHDSLSRASILSNPITLFYTEDHKYLWGSSWTAVFKIERTSTGLNVADYISKEWSSIFSDVFHGAYSLLTHEEVMIVAVANSLEAYYDKPGSNGNLIEKSLSIFTLPPEKAQQGPIRSLCMMADGSLLLVTGGGKVGILRYSRQNSFSSLFDSLWLGEKSNISPPEVSNNIACDDSNGAYIVSSRMVHKVVWDGKNLNVAWETPYDTLEGIQGARLGSGSGSTPSLMGSGNDNYVVITDGSQVMNIIIFDCATGKKMDQYPITFGDMNATRTLSEQSLLVHGWRVATVNNTPGRIFDKNLLDIIPDGIIPETIQTATDTVSAVLPVVFGDAPRGAQQLEFNPLTGKLRNVWENADISIPNGIPSMSYSTGIMYGVGKRGALGLPAAPLRGMWTLEGLDWWSGVSRFYYNIGVGPWNNSIYAATEISENEVITGTASGVLRIRNDI